MDFSKLDSGVKDTYPKGKKYPFQTRFFSDSAVLFMPEDRGDISQFLFLVRYVHDQAVRYNFCLRGAVTIDDMYWDPEWSNGYAGQSTITVGPGIIEAHELESEVAVYPQIIIEPKLYDWVNANGCEIFPFVKSEQRNLCDYFLADFDGQYFLDILHPDVQRPENEKLRQYARGGGQ